MDTTKKIYEGYAPGRTTLNDHVDYYHGIGIGAALKNGTKIIFTPDEADRDRLIITDKRMSGMFRYNVNDRVSAEGRKNGASYVVGVFNYLRKFGLNAAGGKIEIDSQLPQGGGVSSSAALIVSTVNAALKPYFKDGELEGKGALYLLEKPETRALVTNLLKDAGDTLDESHETRRTKQYSNQLNTFFRSLDAQTALRYVNALLSYQVETGYMEKGCGRLDQMSCALADPGQALKINFDNLSFESLPALPKNHEIIIVDSGQSHVIGEHGGAYSTRIDAAQKEIMPFLKLSSILQIKNEGEFETAKARIAKQFGPEKAGWFEHAYRESNRGEAEADAITKGNMNKLAQLINESHTSLSKTYGTSTDLIDELVTEVTPPKGPAKAARIVGGGNGGSVAILVESSQAEAVCRKVDAFRKAKGPLIQKSPHNSSGIKFLETPPGLLKSAGISADGRGLAA